LQRLMRPSRGPRQQKELYEKIEERGGNLQPFRKDQIAVHRIADVIMSLKSYQNKRDFARTPEPKGEIAMTSRRIYVIQEHHASHLHWDLRLEMDGVLKSWALPKEPPREADVRRLAVPVEDHPIEYASFEGTIAEGLYGAGEVFIWDKGTYEPVSISEGKIVVNIDGEKLRGIYCMIKTRFQGKDSWLFFKMKK